MDNAFGPLSREAFQKLVDAPHGHAQAAIRRYDPMWGCPEGETTKFRVRLTRQVTEECFVTVEASSEEEAEDRALDTPERDLHWEYDTHESAVVEHVEAA